MSAHITEVTLVLTTTSGTEAVHTIALGERIELVTVPVKAIEIQAVIERRTKP